MLEQAGMPSMHALRTKRRLRWLGHVSRMEDGRIPKDVLYGELATGTRATDACKRVLRSGNIDPADWEVLAADCTEWRQAINIGVQTSGERKYGRKEGNTGGSHWSQHPQTQTSTPTTYAATTTESAAQASGSSATAGAATPPETDHSAAHIAETDGFQ